MSIETSTKNSDPSSLLAALDGMANKGAFISLVGSGFLAAGIAYLGANLLLHGNDSLAKLIVVVATFVWILGVSASGFLLMDQTRLAAPRSVLDGFLAALITLPKLLGIALTALIVFVGLLLVIALFLAVCKIPGIGPALYAVVFPISVAICGLMVAGLLYVYTALSLPSLWDGCTYSEIIARLWAISRQRLALVILLLLGLVLLTGFTSAVLYGIVFSGIGIVSLISASIIGYGADLYSLNIYSLMSGFSENPYFSAGIFGGVLLFVVLSALAAQVFIKGLCHIYIQSSQGLDFTAAQKEIDAHTEKMKQRAEEAKRRAQASVEKSRASAVVNPRQPLASNDQHCPACGSVINTGDMFCEHCGHQLK